MILLALGVAAMAALHLIAAVPAWKQRVKARTGERLYGPLFGLASLAALAAIVAGWRLSALVPVYDPPAWGRMANFLLTFAGFLSFGVFLFRGKLRQRLRFPMGLAVIFWATGHLLANGDKASLVLFGGLLTYAAAHIGIGLAQGVRPSPDVRLGHDPLSLLAGAALYGVMTQLHPVLIGVPVMVLGQ
jgi:uncharacterized membrane protein